MESSYCVIDLRTVKPVQCGQLAAAPPLPFFLPPTSQHLRYRLCRFFHLQLDYFPFPELREPGSWVFGCLPGRRAVGNSVEKRL